jgi:hypothetical protein
MQVGKKHEYIAGSALADTILDHLVLKGHEVELTGESLRK